MDDISPTDKLAASEADVTSGSGPASEAVLQTWRPSRQPLHRMGEAATAPGGSIVEVAEDLGPLGALRKFLRRPFVRLIIGLGIFILAGIAYDNFVNGGSWTIKPEKAKPAEHRGAKAIPLTPDQ